MIPIFVTLAIYYGESIQEGDPQDWQRFAAITVFLVAAISDGLDGYVARRYNQRSELGAILDPLADKLLLVSGIVLLSFTWPYFHTIPLWLTGTIIGRDILLLTGLIVIHLTVGKVKVRPRILGKVATVFQMVVVLWILLRWNTQWLKFLTVGAALFTGASGLLYVWDGVRQLSAHPSSSPEKA